MLNTDSEKTAIKILLVEDNPGDVRLTREARSDAEVKHSANCCVQKPIDIKEFIEVFRSLNHFWFRHFSFPGHLA